MRSIASEENPPSCLPLRAFCSSSRAWANSGRSSRPLGQRRQLDGDRAQHRGQVLAIEPPRRQVDQRRGGGRYQPQRATGRRQDRSQRRLALGGELIGIAKQQGAAFSFRGQRSGASIGSIRRPRARIPAAQAGRTIRPDRRSESPRPDDGGRCPAVPAAGRWPAWRPPLRPGRGPAAWPA